jgi:DNA-binding response OmpR family regulator
MDPTHAGLSVTQRARRILLVDDSPEGREALDRYLTLQGFDVQAVSSGAAASEALRDEPTIDVVVTDLVLPDLDGREVARLAKLRTPPPLVVLITGWGVDSDPTDLARSGIDLLLDKPVDVRELLARIGGATDPCESP